MTSLFDGSRAGKEELVFEVLGDIDEMSSQLGVVKALMHNSELHGPELTHYDTIESIQQLMITLGGVLATPPGSKRAKEIKPLTEADLEQLELAQRDLMEVTDMPPLFILPGGSFKGAHCDVARTICRRAERKLVSLIKQSGRSDLFMSQKYLNRLSDFLFILARWFDNQ